MTSIWRHHRGVVWSRTQRCVTTPSVFFLPAWLKGTRSVNRERSRETRSVPRSILGGGNASWLIPSSIPRTSVCCPAFYYTHFVQIAASNQPGHKQSVELRAEDAVFWRPSGHQGPLWHFAKDLADLAGSVLTKASGWREQWAVAIQFIDASASEERYLIRPKHPLKTSKERRSLSSQDFDAARGVNIGRAVSKRPVHAGKKEHLCLCWYNT